MKKTYTKEEKQAYFQGLRDQWKQSKELAEKDNDAKAHFEALQREGYSGSYWSYYFTKMAMQAQGLEGEPYIDAKTFQGWKQSGYIVRKGEKSNLSGVTWIECKNPKASEDEDGYLMPKAYALFHKSQVTS